MKRRISKKSIIVVAMSGGVDSSVAAGLLVQQGFRVIGITMKLWEFREVGGNTKRQATCCTIETINDARDVCQTLGIPHYVVDFREDFNKYVVDDFVSEYLLGRTPNPCVNCNIKIKWESLLNKAEEFGAETIATGHYANIGYNESTKRYFVQRGTYVNKDQSYALWGLTQKSLSRTLFPLGEKTKDEVRAAAHEMGLKTADKVESQEICFVPDDDYRRLLKERLSASDQQLLKGDIVTTEGVAVGSHEGYPYFTIGQRRGLGIALGKPAYVVDILPEDKKIVIGDKSDLLKRGLLADKMNWSLFESLEQSYRFFVKIRYRDPGAFATVTPKGKMVEVLFDEPQAAITPGQSVVFYEEDKVVGGGIIEKSI